MGQPGGKHRGRRAAAERPARRRGEQVIKGLLQSVDLVLEQLLSGSVNVLTLEHIRHRRGHRPALCQGVVGDPVVHHGRLPEQVIADREELDVFIGAELGEDILAPARRRGGGSLDRSPEAAAAARV